MTGNTSSVVTTLLQPVEIGIVLRSLRTKYLKPYYDATTTFLCKIALKLVYRVGFSRGMCICNTLTLIINYLTTVWRTIRPLPNNR